MENIAFDIWLSGRMDFSAEERRECFAAAKEMVQIAADVRRNGLLSIDEKIPKMDDAFLRKYMQLAVDSIDPETINRLAQTHIIANNYKGKKLLKSVLIKEGVLSIVNGESPKYIKEKLATYFGDELLQEFNDYFDIKDGLEYDVAVVRNKVTEVIAKYGYSGDKLSQEEIDALIIKIIKGEI